MSNDRELLFGVMAVQLGVADAATVMASGAEWATRRTEGLTLGDLLVERKAITKAQLTFLNDVVARALVLHGTEASALAKLPTTLVASTLTSLSGSPSVEDSVSVSDTLHSGERRMPHDSLSGLDNVSTEALGRYEPEVTEEGRETELGRGGIGRVLSVMDHFIGRHVALKMLLPTITNDVASDTAQTSSIESRFLREARVTGQLEHPGIVPVYEIGRRQDGSLYYTMRRIEGRTLHDAIAAAKTLPERLKLMPHLIALCQAIAYAHNRGVIHRDIKPQNVMLGAFGETYVLDWGLARVKGRLDTGRDELRLAPDITGALDVGAVGTPAYMSPEQAFGRIAEIDERSDVWGLGAVLFELLSGSTPYTGSSAWDVIGKIRTDSVRSVRALEPNVPEDLAAVCHRALARERIDRYPTALELAQDLESWRQGKPVAAKMYKLYEIWWRFARRNAISVGIATAGIVALLAVGLTSALHIRTERNEARVFAQVVLTEVTKHLVPQASSQPVIESLTDRALAFYAHMGSVEDLDETDRLSLAQAMARLSNLNRQVGQLEKATSTLAMCKQLLPPLEAVSRKDEQAQTLFDCLTTEGDVAMLRGKSAEALAQWRELEKTLRRLTIDKDDPKWMRVASQVLTRIGNEESNASDLNDAYAHLKEALGYDEKILAMEGDDVVLKTNLAASRRDVALLLWRMGKHDDALFMNGRAVVLGRTIPRTDETVRAASILGSSLRQQGLFLIWSTPAKDEEGLKAFQEAAEVLAWTVAKRPEQISFAGEYADTLLELGQPAKARALLEGPLKQGVGGDYRASYVLAALLEGRFTEVQSMKPDIEAGTDAQEALALGIAQALESRTGAAAISLRLAHARLDNAGIQWPKHALTPLINAHPGAVADALQVFAQKFETAYAVDDDAALKGSVLELASTLEAIH